MVGRCAGLFIFLFASVAFAQSKGEVESIGFNGFYRPSCWTPMVVRISPGSLEPGFYQLQVEQKDLDQDTQVFTRTIQINAADQAAVQHFSMYFLPTPADHGLPDTDVRELGKNLKVWLCNESGRQLQLLPITSSVNSAESPISPPMGRKLVLCVGDGSSRPMTDEFTSVIGIPEAIVMVVVRPEDLPESALGYDGVDAIVWSGGDAEQLDRAGAHRLEAITQYVKTGGTLIVSQPSERGKIEALAPLLPIQLKDAAGNWLLETRPFTNGRAPLANWAKPPLSRRATQTLLAQPPFRIGHTTNLKPLAFSEWNIAWSTVPDAPDVTPYLVRQPIGLGQSVWVAQDLADPALTNALRTGWVGIWNKVFDTKDDARFPQPGAFGTNGNVQFTRADEDVYGSGETVRLGHVILAGVEHSARGLGLVTLAIVFFIAYWLIAGPVSFAVLFKRKQKNLSWPIFGAAAVLATLLTIGVVRLVLGAGGDLHHISFVQWTPGQPAVVDSRIGVYLTKSENMPITLEKTNTEFVNTLSAFDPPPDMNDSDGFIVKERYTVPVPEAGATSLDVTVPFRSTLKKMQARWIGDVKGIEGSAQLTEATEDSPQPRLAGLLTNKCGHDLNDVYVGFTARRANGKEFEDRIYYIPKWPHDGDLNLGRDLTDPKVAQPLKLSDAPGALPRQGPTIGDIIYAGDDGWTSFWFLGGRSGVEDDGGLSGGADPQYLRSFPMISFFGRLPAVRRTGAKEQRFNLLRNGVRRFDRSASFAAGDLVVLAQDAANADNSSPLPIPFKVGGSTIDNSGVTFYQFVLPLNRTQSPAATQPSMDIR